MSKPSNEQIAHDLAVAFVADGWRAEEVAEQNSIIMYRQKYREFLNELNRA